MKIVINRSDAIGDNILTMPMAALLKNSFQGCEIIFITSPKCSDLFLNHPYIDKVWVLDHKLTFIKKLLILIKLFKESDISHYFHVGGSHVPTIASMIARVKFRGGLRSKWQTFLFLNKSVRQRRSMVEMHDAEYNMNLLEVLDIKYDSKMRCDLSPEIHIEEEHCKSARDNFIKRLVDQGYDEKIVKREWVFIHPGMVGHTLNWPSRNYARLIIQLEKRHPNRFFYLLSHTAVDLPYLEALNDELAAPEYDYLKRVIYFLDGGHIGLSEYMRLLKSAKIFIGPSTGTTHIANALGVKQVAIYSPIKVQSAMRWGPFCTDRDRVRIIVPDVVCGEQFTCSKMSCPHYECMAIIEVSEIIKEIEDLCKIQTK